MGGMGWGGVALSGGAVLCRVLKGSFNTPLHCRVQWAVRLLQYTTVVQGQGSLQYTTALQGVVGSVVLLACCSTCNSNNTHTLFDAHLRRHSTPKLLRLPFIQT